MSEKTFAVGFVIIYLIFGAVLLIQEQTVRRLEHKNHSQTMAMQALHWQLHRPPGHLCPGGTVCTESLRLYDVIAISPGELSVEVTSEKPEPCPPGMVCRSEGVIIENNIFSAPLP